MSFYLIILKLCKNSVRVRGENEAEKGKRPDSKNPTKPPKNPQNKLQLGGIQNCKIKIRGLGNT